MQTKRILQTSLIIAVVIFAQILTSCNSNNQFPEVKQQNFTKQLYELSGKAVTAADVASLKKQYGRFFNIWFYEILDFSRLGNLSDSATAMVLADFLQKNKPVFPAVDVHFKKYNELSADINFAVGKMKSVLQEKGNFEVVSYFSQFSNYNTFVDTVSNVNILAYSAEMFMDDTFALYKALEVPGFYNRYNGTNRIPAMLVWNYLKSKYDNGETGKNMLEESVLNGKIWYTMMQVFEDADPWELFGYTEKEWKQMTTEEGQMWKHYLDAEALFSRDFNKYKRYFIYGDHTFGAGIPPDCPPMIGMFTGLRIVEKYVEKSGVDIAGLWKTTDAEKILRLSGYNPIK